MLSKELTVEKMHYGEMHLLTTELANLFAQ